MNDCPIDRLRLLDNIHHQRNFAGEGRFNSSVLRHLGRIEEHAVHITVSKIGSPKICMSHISIAKIGPAPIGFPTPRLSNANLRGADLQSANLEGATSTPLRLPEKAEE